MRPRLAQVCEFELHPVAAMSQQEVGGPEIAMHDAGRVECQQGASRLQGQGQHLRQRQRRTPRQHGIQTLAGKRLQNQGRVRPFLDQGQRVEDFGAIDGLEQCIFAPQALDGVLLCGKLEQDIPPGGQLPGKVQRTTGGDGDLLEYLIVAHLHPTALSQELPTSGGNLFLGPL